MTLLAKIEARLVDDWRYVGKFWSQRLNGAGVALLSATQIASDAWNQMPPDLRHALPYARALSIALFVGGFLARYVPQPKTQAKIAEKMEDRRGDNQQDA